MLIFADPIVRYLIAPGLSPELQDTSAKLMRILLLSPILLGMGIAANRHPGIRAAVCATPDLARLSREHNDANVLCVGKRILQLNQVLDLVDIWLSTSFSGGERHCRRVQKMG